MTNPLAAALHQRRQRLVAQLDDSGQTIQSEKSGQILERTAGTSTDIVSGAQLSARFAEFEQGLKTLQLINDEMHERLENLK